MTTFIVQAKNGGLNIGSDYNRARLREFLKTHEGIRLRIEPEMPEESTKLRKYFEGCLVPLAAFYQENLDHRNRDDLDIMREWIKQEWNSEVAYIAGKPHRVAKSSKGRKHLNPIVDSLVEWLTENYAPPNEAFDPTAYDDWKCSVYPFGGPDNYIDYLVDKGVLARDIQTHEWNKQQ